MVTPKYPTAIIASSFRVLAVNKLVPYHRLISRFLCLFITLWCEERCRALNIYRGKCCGIVLHKNRGRAMFILLKIRVLDRICCFCCGVR